MASNAKHLILGEECGFIYSPIQNLLTKDDSPKKTVLLYLRQQLHKNFF